MPPRSRAPSRSSSPSSSRSLERRPEREERRPDRQNDRQSSRSQDRSWERPQERSVASAERSSAPAERPSDRPARSDRPHKKSDKPVADGWLFGHHAVAAALLNPQRRCRRLLGTREGLSLLQEALDRSRSIVVPEMVERSEIDAVLGGSCVHQGVAMKVDPLPLLAPEDILDQVERRQEAVVLVLDQVTDPHNVGAVLRSAAALGAVAVVVQDRHSPDESGTLAKAASGALETMPLVRVANLARALQTFQDGGFWVAGLAADAPVSIGKAKLSGKIVLCLGSEGEGLRRLTRETCDVLVRLPMVPQAVESLNVSNAAALALYAVRQSILDA